MESARARRGRLRDHFVPLIYLIYNSRARGKHPRAMSGKKKRARAFLVRLLRG
nr:MAG TPA: hypothetical protein [Caudoviricetes sp.]